MMSNELMTHRIVEKIEMKKKKKKQYFNDVRLSSKTATNGIIAWSQVI